MALLRPAPSAPDLRMDVAREFTRKHFVRSVAPEVIAVAKGFGRILAGDFIASADLPRFKASAMDGFAVRSSDLHGSGQRRLKIIGRSAAGHPAHLELGQSETMRVLTGSVLPAGADW